MSRADLVAARQRFYDAPPRALREGVFARHSLPLD